jgi:hypothetical protein
MASVAALPCPDRTVGTMIAAPMAASPPPATIPSSHTPAGGRLRPRMPVRPTMPAAASG